jgi:hypothetical protein
MAALLISDGPSQRSVAAALVDLATQGLVHFRSDTTGTGSLASVGATGKGQMPETPEGHLGVAIAGFTGPDGFIDGNEFDTMQLATALGSFQSELADLASQKGWLRGNPATIIATWLSVGVVEIVAGLALGYWTWRLDAFVGLIGAVGLGIVGLATVGVAFLMPSLTKEGSMIRAMVLAYRQTLIDAMQQSHSMADVVSTRKLPWLDTPDMAMAWGIAFGLDSEIDAVMSRAVSNLGATGAQNEWYPRWYETPGQVSLVGLGEAALGAFSPQVAAQLGSVGAALGLMWNLGVPQYPSHRLPGHGFDGAGGGFGGGGGAGGGF